LKGEFQQSMFGKTSTFWTVALFLRDFWSRKTTTNKFCARR